MTVTAAIDAGNVTITAFVLLIVDRTAALFVASLKARRLLAKKVTAATPRTLPIRLVRWFERWYWSIQAMIFLAAFWMLGILQIASPTHIQDEVGKISFAAAAFIISFGCSILNSVIEELDRRL